MCVCVRVLKAAGVSKLHTHTHTMNQLLRLLTQLQHSFLQSFIHFLCSHVHIEITKGHKLCFYIHTIQRDSTSEEQTQGTSSQT